MIGADDVAEFFSRPIAFHRALVGVGHSGVTGALLLSQAIYWQRVKDKTEPRGWFWKTGADWREETGMTRDELQTARRRLVNDGLIEYELRGVPATGYYRVNFEKLASSLLESRKLDCGKPANLAAGNPPTSSRESRNLHRTETTPENTQRVAAGAKAPLTDATWRAYSEMLKGVYGVEAVRSAKVNAMLSGLVKDFGAEAALRLVQYFFTVKNRFYERVKHDLKILVKDARTLHVEMVQAERSAAAATDRWWTDANGITAKAQKLGIQPKPDDSFASITARVFLAAGQGPWLHKIEPAVSRHMAELSQRESVAA
jgi:hypothetical protein